MRKIRAKITCHDQEPNEEVEEEIDYENEYAILRYRLKETEDELYKYKQALLNVCLNMK